METQPFNELLASIQEAGQMLRGEREPQRRFEVKPVEVRRIRKQLDASQPDFADHHSRPPQPGAGRQQPEGPAAR